MGIADLKTRLRDIPGIETLTMQMLAGRQNYNLNGRVIALDAGASDIDVEQAIRAAIASPAIAQMPAGTPIPAAPAIAALPAVNVQVAAASSAAAPLPSATAHPASAGLSVKQMMDEHTRMMGEIQAAQVELLRATLARQRQAVSSAVGSVAQKIEGQTEDFLSVMGQFTNDLGI
ncbi:hypothetical protein [Bradyrhizobium sp.]|uniref:hypothetical protein n=1 Tax=Bradyrhizobium sp. TaxID=376 RepID=UPI003C6968B2